MVLCCYFLDNSHNYDYNNRKDSMGRCLKWFEINKLITTYNFKSKGKYENYEKIFSRFYRSFIACMHGSV